MTIRNLALLPLTAAVLATAACGQDATTPARPAAVTITGTITVPGGDTVQGLEGGPGQTCRMGGGYDDIRQGAQVVVTDETGAVVALGALDSGVLDLPDAEHWGTRKCAFPFTVQAPTGRTFYGVEVSHRGRLQFTEQQLATPLELTLGS